MMCLRHSWRRAAVGACLAVLCGCPRSGPNFGDTTSWTDASGPDLDGPAADRPRPDRFRWPDLAADRRHKDLEQLRDAALKDALYALIKGQSGLSYTKAKSAMFVPSAGGLDVHDGMIECVYTGIKVPADGTISPGGFNVEHSWPQSEGADTAPAEGDLHHLFPAEANANSRRSSLPFGDCACGGAAPPCKWEQGGSRYGPSATGGTVFEVRLARRGDIARAHFYFAVRYKMAIGAEEENALRVWNTQDLPDALERERNDAIEGLQNNRNPFVDRPDFVDRITDF
jgi:hypothetical protein